MTDIPPPTSQDFSKGERTRADIILAAHDLIIQKGYHGTSMRQIAAQVGIALSGIYNHFNSKEEIFREVLLAYHPYHEIFPILANAQYDQFEEMIRHVMETIDKTLEQRPDIINLMFIEIVEFQNRHIPDLLKRIMPHMLEMLQRFSDAESSLRPIPFPMLMRTMMGMLMGYFITKHLLIADVPQEFTENARDYFVDIYLHGIMKTESPS